MATRAPLWTLEEFEILLAHPNLSNDELSQKLPHRTTDAVGFVRSGIHDYHLGRDNQILSKMMQERLVRSKGREICPICGERVQENSV